MISEEQVVNSLIKKDLDWHYGEITQTGINTYFYEADDFPQVQYIMDRIPPPYNGHKIRFINGELTIEQNRVVYDRRLSEENEKILKEHINNKVIKKREEENTRFIDWITK